MKYIRILSKLVLMCMAVAVTSCQDDIDLPNGAGTEDYGDCYFILDNGNSPASRATYNDIENTVFDEGDIVGVFGLDQDDNLCKDEENVPYAVRVIAGTLSPDGTITPSTKRSLKPATGREVKKSRAKYLFYYPYREDMTLEEAKKLTHTVQGDQTTKEAYEASDLLWDVASPTDGGKYCHIVMEHAMANIIIVLDHKFYNKNKGIRVSGVNTTASDVNLLTSELEDMSYATDNYEESLLAWSFGNDARGSSVFRIAVPAQTIPGGSSTGAKSYFITATSSDGDIKTFKLRSDLAMKPGHNYIFQLTINAVPIQDYGDDDSWVLDVVDPDNGELVGLLCREYIRYQPQYDRGEVTREMPTSPQNSIHRDERTSGNEPRINSQCWVFYNLEEDGKTPDLTHGTILRLIYDVRINQDFSDDDDYRVDGKPGGCAWPPKFHYGDGINVRPTGCFLAKHGCEWRYDPNVGGGNSVNEQQYYMHGTEIYWNGTKGVNKIEYVVLPRKEASATNEEAYWNGHIAIPEDGKPYVSYTTLDYGSTVDKDDNRVGFTIPHHLTDMRKGLNGETEVIRYPLVKIGFNQFWMSKSFRGKRLNNGKELTCYNLDTAYGIDADNVPYYAKRYHEGYIYPFNVTYNYDPIRIHGGIEACKASEIAPCYNQLAFYNDDLIPISHESAARYVRPTQEMYEDFVRYVGWIYMVKMMSNNIVLNFDGYKKDNESLTALLDKGDIVYAQTAPYAGNISGLNLRSDGGYSQATGMPSLGDDITMWLQSKDSYTYGMKILNCHSYRAWGNTPGHEFLENKRDPDGYPCYYPGNDGNQNPNPNGYKDSEHFWTITYAPIRYFLQFNVLKETCNIPRSRSMEPSKRHVSRDVYVGVEECKHKNTN